jgi:hypothetical protein
VSQGLVQRPLPKLAAETPEAPEEPPEPTNSLFEPPSGRERERSP